jgi:uncharacterized damage-inducible protein DinB
MNPEDEFLKNATSTFETYKSLADRALAQISDEQFFAALDEESNSIAVIVKHVAGNMKSRWTNFLTSDGEKPDRDRDAEFEMSPSATREALMTEWEYGWDCAFRELKALSASDLMKTIYIRGEPHSVMKAIGRQLTHGAYHVGQIVFLAKHFADGSWKSLTIPRGRSKDVNAAMLT